MKKYAFIITAVFAVLLLGAGLIFLSMQKKSAPDLGSGPKVRLPAPSLDGTVSVERALKERRSVREYGKGPLALSELSQLLWSAQGVTGERGKRSAPSAGALYPLELYVVAGNVDGLPPGVYKYAPVEHELTRVREGDIRGSLSGFVSGQDWVEEAPAGIVFAAVYERTTRQYGGVGERYVHMEVGHAAQNVYLQAVSLGVGTVMVGAIEEKGIRKLLGMAEDEVPLALMPVGSR